MTAERWAQIEKVYHAALERAAGERAAYLAQACDGDAELRQEVESLLRHDDRTGDLLEAPAMEIAAKAMASESTMSLAGKQLGSYQVVARIGAGGMGEVYRARDSKLGREVAIKVLPPEFVKDADRLSRFRREAKLLASLNHPNIATIYGLEDSGEIHFLVMELVEGGTLAARVASGLFPVRDALKISQQIAEALEHAHEHKVIHRDLKPANVILTKTGRVKVLDFGLAKAFTDEQAGLGDAPTVSILPTEAGRVMGTPAYMSPEQAQGKEVDKQTDIWAFGCVLYELLTGQRAFPGDNVSQIIATVLRSEPDWQKLPSDTPHPIRSLMRRCLQKEQSRRFHSAADLAIEIEESLASSELAAETLAPALPKARKSWPAAILVIALGIVLAGLMLALRTRGPAPTSGPVARFDVALPYTEQVLGVDAESPLVAISPDGTRVVNVVRRNGVKQLYIRSLNELEFSPIPETEGAAAPFFSPDSQWIGYSSQPDGKLKKVSVNGGPPLVICDSRTSFGADWGDRDTIVLANGTYGELGLEKVSASGGEPEPVASPNASDRETSLAWPELLPGGKAIIFTAVRSGEIPSESKIYAQPLGGGERKLLVAGGAQPHYVSTGHLVYSRGATLMAVPFDPVSLEVRGSPSPVVNGIFYNANTTDATQFDISQSGVLVFISRVNTSGTAPQRLVWVDRKGESQPIPAPVRSYEFPRLSPDGRRIAIHSFEGKSAIWVYDLGHESMTRLTSEGDTNWPVWTPDGKRVTFSSDRDGSYSLFWKMADGSGAEERLFSSQRGLSPRAWTPDGRELIFTETNPTTDSDIFVLPAVGDRKPRVFLQTPAGEGWASLSPDGHWLAYVSKELARSEVYVQPFPGPGGRVPISTDGGAEPAWARNGRELFYRNSDKMMAVDISTEAGFNAGRPRVLFESSRYVRVSTTADYDVSPDGQHFLMLENSEPESALHLNVVLNWFEELKQKVPAGK